MTGYKGLKTLTNDEVLALPVDVIIATAPDEGAINELVAPTVKAKIICELANGMTTPQGDAILHKNGAHVIPDFLCNIGGVTMSYYEMVQNMYYWTVGGVYTKLDSAMTVSYHAVQAVSKKYNLNMRQAAYVVAVKCVVEARRVHGWVYSRPNSTSIPLFVCLLLLCVRCYKIFDFAALCGQDLLMGKPLMMDEAVPLRHPDGKQSSNGTFLLLCKHIFRDLCGFCADNTTSPESEHKSSSSLNTDSTANYAGY